MMPVGENIASISGFKGIFRRGLVDNCPPDHLVDCVNCEFPGNNLVRTRYGFRVTQALPANAVYFFHHLLSGTPWDYIILDTTGKVWGGPVLMLKDFGINCDALSCINLFGRVYISPTSRGVALPGEYLYYWDGVSSTLTLAAGLPILITMLAASHINAGNVSAGNHNLAFVIRYVTGFLSKPFPIPNYVIVAPGSKRVDLSLQAVAPNPLIDSVYIVMSRAGENELFFVPNGTFPWGTLNTFFDAADNELVVSADYLHDNLEIIPSAASIRQYKGRLCLIGPRTNANQVYVSRQQDIESFSTVDGVIDVPHDAPGNVLRTGMVIRDTLYLAKYTGTWATQDNGESPSSWAVSTIDSGFGASERGLSGFVSALPGSEGMEMFLIVHPAGLFIFDGAFRVPPLSWKIEDIWRSINFNYLDKVTIAHDLWDKKVYIGYPPAASAANTSILMMDYKEGLSPETVKWSYWTPSVHPTHLGMALLTTDPIYKLRMAAQGSPFIYSYSPGVIGDEGATIRSTLVLPGIAPKVGWVSIFSGIKFRVKGKGLLTPYIVGEDGQPIKTFVGIILDPDPQKPAKDLLRQVHFTGEKAFLQLESGNNAEGYFELNRVDFHAVPRWPHRPGSV